MPWTLSAFADEAADATAGQIAALRDAGLRYIDIRTLDGCNISALPLEHARRVRGQLDAAGISCAMFGSPIGKIDVASDFQPDLARLDHLAALSEVLNCRNVRIFSYYNQKAAMPKLLFQKESLSRLKLLKERAHNLGLVLYHENESDIFGDHAEDVLTIAQALRDAPGEKACFKMIFDFGNFNAGRENVWENWQRLRDFTDGFHLKDNHRTFDGKMHHLPVGEGDGRVRDILAEAAQRGISGPLAIEPHLHQSPAPSPAGKPFSSIPRSESFQIACRAAMKILASANIVTEPGS